MSARMYHSGVFYKLAREACSRAREDNQETYGAIVFSVVALETFLNEFSEDCLILPDADVAPESLRELGKQLQDLESHNEGVILIPVHYETILPDPSEQPRVALDSE